MKITTKKQLARKNMIELDGLADELGIEFSEDMNKSERVEILWAEHNSVAVAEENAEKAEELAKFEEEKTSDEVVDLAEMDAKDVIKKIFGQGLLYKIDAHTWWGKSTKCREEETSIIAEKKVFSGTKTLIDPAELGLVKSARAHGERALSRLSFSFLGIRGVQFVPKGYISILEEELKEAKKDHDESVTEFVDNFEAIKNRWAGQLGSLYDESLYPSEKDLIGKFQFSWTKFKIDVPSDMMNDDEYQAELEKQKKNIIEFVDGTVTTLASELYGLLVNLKERIAEGKDVNMKTMNSIARFVESFKMMDISGNTTLKGLVESTQKAFGTITKVDGDDKQLMKKIKDTTNSLIKEITESSDKRIQRSVEF